MNEKCPIDILLSFWATTDLCLTAPEKAHDHLPRGGGRDLVWNILKCIVCHNGIRKHSLCPITTSCVPAPPFSSSATPPSGQQSTGASFLCGLISWFIGEPPINMRMPSDHPSPVLWREKNRHAHGEIDFLYHFTVPEKESTLLVLCFHFLINVFIIWSLSCLEVIEY